jgi:hypothetical protein
MIFVKALIRVMARWLWLLGVLTMIMMWGASEAPAQAETFQEVFCRYLCPPLDRGLGRIDTQVRIAWANGRA